MKCKSTFGSTAFTNKMIFSSSHQHLVAHEVGAFIDHEAAAFHPTGAAVAQIVFYEDKNFQGRSFECSIDCPELSSHFSHCNSIQVKRWAWVLYEDTNFMGCQYILTRGEYPDYQRWMGFNDSIRSCRMVRNVSQPYTGAFRIRLYKQPEFQGQIMESIEDWPYLYDRFHHREVQSCNVLDGAWVFFEHPNYRGYQYLLERGEFRRFSDWNAMHPTVGSIHRVQEL
ncbi:crystallin, gamma S3 [Siphateles boraxobius]|uniref:crystallin, gamma S3 n=1 Tax=Siphateles boraxobius TaxID=180520 RepID=UPI004062DEE6